MIKGIFFAEDGFVQQIGELATFQNVIQAIQTVLPQLIEKEKEQILSSLSDDDLEKLIKSRKTKKLEVSEP